MTGDERPIDPAARGDRIGAPRSATERRPPVVVLGAGPAGLAAAYRLARRGWPDVTVVERAACAGGNAGSFIIDGIPVDFGSHRLHPSCPRAVLEDIRALLGADLLDRPRHGRIRLRGRWVRFPLKPFDLAARLPPSFIAGVLRDLIRRPRSAEGDENFRTILERGLGPTICRDFYFPYAEKIWGVPPEALDAEQARRRVSAGSLGRMLRRVARALPGVGPRGGARFFYPRHGYGQISDAFRGAAEAAGVRVLFESPVAAIHADATGVIAVDVDVRGERRTLPAGYVFSTVPVTALPRFVRGPALGPVEAARTLRQRSMVLIYLTLAIDRFTEFDAHYFPEASIRISRLSEPKHYSQTVRPGRTVLCAELPCGEDSAEWAMSDDALGRLVASDLEHAGLGPMPAVLGVETRRLSNAYPLYTRGYREAFDGIDRWARGIRGLVTFGRQGLFVHDNTHHAMAMAYEAVGCLGDDGTFDEARWLSARASFEAHVVED